MHRGEGIPHRRGVHAERRAGRIVIEQKGCDQQVLGARLGVAERVSFAFGEREQIGDQPNIVVGGSQGNGESFQAMRGGAERGERREGARRLWAA